MQFLDFIKVFFQYVLNGLGQYRRSVLISLASPYLPSEHKKAHFLKEQESGKEENPGTRAISYLALITSKFDKTLMLYAMRISCYYRENTK